MATAMDMVTDTVTAKTMTPDKREPLHKSLSTSSVVTLLLASLILAGLAASAAIGAVLNSKSPEIAADLFPQNGFALGYAGSRMIDVERGSQNLSTDAPQQLAAVSRAALAKEITDARALSNLALATEQLDADNARALYSHSLQLSRRNTLSQVYFIRRGAERGDYPTAFAHVSTLLRVEPETRQVMLPLLVQLLSFDDSIEPLAQLLKQQGGWVDEFWQTAAESEAQLTNLVQLRNSFAADSSAIKRRNDEFIAEALVNNQRYDDAWNFARRFFPELSERSNDQLLVNGNFRSLPSTRPFDWKVYSTGTQSVSINPDSGQLAVSRFRGPGGPIASQFARVSSPSVSFGAEFEPISDPQQALDGMTLQAVCVWSDRQEAAATIPMAQLYDAGRQTVELPDECRNLLVVLMADAQESSAPRDVFVREISLRAL